MNPVQTRLFPAAISAIICLGLCFSPQAAYHDFVSGFDESNPDATWSPPSGAGVPSQYIVSDPGPFNVPGNKIVRLRVPAGRGGSGTQTSSIPPSDTIFARWYMQWEPGYDFTDQNHAGAGVRGGGRYSTSAGRKPDGTDGFTFSLEADGARSGNIFFYSYYVGMHMDCSSATSCYGEHIPCHFANSSYCQVPPLIMNDPTPNASSGTWHSLEMRVIAGDPVQSQNQANGSLTFWMDGKQYGPWGPLWVRKVSTLKVNWFKIGVFYHNDDHSAYGILYDDVVVSRKRVGDGFRIGPNGENAALIPPFRTLENPIAYSKDVDPAAGISAHIRDLQEGVNPSSIAMKINGNAVTPTVTGSPNDFLVSYQPPVPFAKGEKVSVAFEAKDAAGNDLPPETYWFVTDRDTVPSSDFKQIKINFQPAYIPVPAGFYPDHGEVFGLRASGHKYGWDQDIQKDFRHRGQFTMMATLTGVNIHSGDRKWEIEVPNGQYTVYIMAVDLDYLSNRKSLEAEGVTIVDGTGIQQGQKLVTVSDGRLTVKSTANSTIGSTGKGSNVICAVQIAQGDNDPTSLREWEMKPEALGISRLNVVQSNIQTMVHYYMDEPGMVSIRVMNQLGQQVKTLEHQFRGKGNYAVKWNGLDRNGKQLPNGVYYVRARAGRHSMTKRMLLMR